MLEDFKLEGKSRVLRLIILHLYIFLSYANIRIVQVQLQPTKLQNILGKIIVGFIILDINLQEHNG